MKRTSLFLVIMVLMGSAFAKAQLPNFQSAYKNLLSTYVSGGQVDYAAIKENSKSLHNALIALAKTDVNALQGNQRKAQLINAYNLFVIQGIVEDYPIKSVMDIDNFFDVKQYQLGDQKVSLNQLEKKMIYPEFADPRIHFALVCGAVSCPPLLSKPFTAENVEFMLKKLTRASINDPSFIKVDMHEKKATVSQIFNWYTSHFTRNGDVIEYLNTYREDMIPDGFTVDFSTYDWSLNDK
jgi:hypothetical protein